MSDVLIRGMNMPTCYTCPFESMCGKWALHDVEWQKENRDADCPLVEVPDHGDLIDRDKIIIPLLDKEKWVKVAIDAAPTIIPASRKG